MGRGRKGTGVEPRANDYRIRFTWNGRRYAMVEALKPCAPHFLAVKRKAAEVQRAVEDGTFTFERFFPDSPHARAPATVTTSYGYYAGLWLTASSELAAATRGQYGNAIKFWKRQRVDGIALDIYPIERLAHSKLAALVGGIKWPSARMRNNSLIALRGPVAMWVADDRRHRDNPMDGIENAAFTKGKPDPLEAAEAERVIARMYEKWGEAIGAYFEVALFEFLRPEEEIALRWEKLDFARRTALIDVVRTFKGGEKAPKTYEVREVEFTDRGWAAILRMKPLTFLKPHGHVFDNPRTGKPWHDERSQRDHYWTPALKSLGVRARRAYCTRHTGITLALAAGCDPQWVARKAGHKNTKMIWEVYTKWIPGQDHGREVAKVNAKYALSA